MFDCPDCGKLLQITTDVEFRCLDSSDGVSSFSEHTRSSHPSAASGGRRWPATTSGKKADGSLRRPTGARTDCERAADDGGRHIGLRGGRGIDDQGRASGVAVAKVSTNAWSTVGAQLEHSWSTVGPQFDHSWTMYFARHSRAGRRPIL